MEQTETATAEGTGTWGNVNYKVSLYTRLSTYHDSARTRSQTVVRYFVAIDSGTYADCRGFESEKARRLFIEKSFSELTLTEIPEGQRTRRGSPLPFVALVGETVQAIVFVMDYLQLQLSSGTFNFYRWPTVMIGRGALHYGEAGYRDALCEFIDKAIRDVDEVLGEGLRVEFSEGTLILALNLDRDFRWPEVAEVSGRNKLWIVWMAGQPPFEHS
jgi:hypothetical protein